MKTFTARHEHGIANVFIFLILAMFLVGSTLLVVMGARVYRGTSERSAEHSQARVLCTYLRQSVHADDADEIIMKQVIDGTDVMTISNVYGGERYERDLFVADGQLRERFAEAGEPFDLEDGEPVCAAQGFEFDIDGKLLTARLTDEAGEVHTLYIALHTARA